MDLKHMAVNLGLDEDDFRELTELLISTTLADLAKLEDGVAGGNASEAASAAHSIKGAAGNMGFMELSAIAAAVEADARGGRFDTIRDKVETMRQELAGINRAIGR